MKYITKHLSIVIILVSLSKICFAQTGLDSTKAIEITDGQTINDNTQGSPSNVKVYSGATWNESGPEDLFTIQIQQTSRLIATLTNISVNLDIFILNSCNSSKCVAYGDKKAVHANLTPGRYYIVVDGRDNSVGSYSLTAQCETGFHETATTVWSESFEYNPDKDWHTDYGVWEMGSPTSGPNSAFVGNSCAATKLAGDYPDNKTTSLIRDTFFDVPDASQFPRLRFWHWYSFNSGDWGKVIIKVYGTDKWEDLPEASFSSHCSYVWTCRTIDLSAYAGKTVQIAFWFHSEDVWPGGWETSHGWYIDNVSFITGKLRSSFPENWEPMKLEDWNVSSGVWEIGVPTSGPLIAYSPPYCAATVLDGVYGDWSGSRLVSPKLKLVPATVLRFHHWYSFNSGDWGKLEIRTEKRTDPIVLDNYTGSSYGWTYPRIDLAAYGDSTVQIAFHFHSEDVWPGGWEVDNGWYLDNLEITPSPIIVTVKDELKNCNCVQSFSLNQNYPNPFNPSTTIEFSIPYSSHVVLKIYDVLGKEAATLADGELPMGQHKVNWNGQNLASGVYIYKIQAGEFVQTKKMILMH